MRTRLTEDIKRVVRPSIYQALHPRKARYRCPVCAYKGPFKDKRVSRVPDVMRTDSKCPRCGSTERHRLTALVLDEVFREWDPSGRSLLHVAPEFCLQPRLRRAFGTYHTTDLFRTDVDFVADLQDLPFEDASYDCVFVSRVLTIPPDLDACLRETRRVLKPGGLAIVSEYFVAEKTFAVEDETVEAVREMGVDLLDRFRERFDRVECRTADEFPSDFQMVNRIHRDGAPFDDFPEIVRAPGVGAKELLTLCWVGEGA